jgi:hypothetical protein
MKFVLTTGKSRLTRGLAGVLAVGTGMVLCAACSSSAASSSNAGSSNAGSNTATVQLNPASGPTTKTPTWSTSVACPSGYQGSGLFSEAHADGTFTTIAPAVTSTNTPFHGTLLGSIARIKSIGGIPDGSTQELFMICASGPGGTGKNLDVMKVYVTYSADGNSYTTQSTP